MKNLLSTPDFDGLPRLQKLTILDCVKLEVIHSSLGNHASLESVRVYDCYKLRNFPRIVQMEKLKTLEIDYCFKIFGLREILVLPSIAERCTNLISLGLSQCKLNIKEFIFDGFIHLKVFKYSLGKQTQLSEIFRQWASSLRNLVELDLSLNDFTRLDFSLSQMTRLKLLKLDNCYRLVDLPELPSGLAILQADYCFSLSTVGDCHTNCKRLCQVSLMHGSNVIDGSKLLQSMLQGKATENHSMFLQIEGLEIPKEFEPRLIRGSRCTLQLPENWCNDFCGFLICAVSTQCYVNLSVLTNMKQVMSGMDSQHDEVWKESDGSSHTLVEYVSFGALRHASWWDQTYKAVSFDIDILHVKGL